MKIALDVMGGDNAPDINVDGAKRALRDLSLIHILYSCGMRLSELVGLDVGSVDHRFRGVKVMGKGRKERILPVGTPALAARETYVSMACLPKNSPLFVSRIGRVSRGCHPLRQGLCPLRRCHRRGEPRAGGAGREGGCQGAQVQRR